MPTITDLPPATAAVPQAGIATPDSGPLPADRTVTGFAASSDFERTGDRPALTAKLDQTLATLRDQAERGEFLAPLAEQCLTLAGKLGRGVRPELREVMLTAMARVPTGQEAAVYERLLANLEAGVVAGDFGDEVSGPLAALRARIPELCRPQALDTSTWSRNRHLTVHEATSRRYVCTWAVNRRTWEFNIPADGWISDCFIAPGRSIAVVHWHVASGQVRVTAAGGNPLDARVARACAAWARNTIFPGVRLETLTWT